LIQFSNSGACFSPRPARGESGSALIPTSSLREAQRRSNPVFLGASGLLRFARNDANDNAPCSTHYRHTPRRRSIQYAASTRFNHGLLGILDHPPSRMMTVCADTTPHSRDILRPSFANSFAPKERGRSATLKRGRGEDRVRAAPAVPCAKVANRKRTRAYRFSGSSPAFPAQWFYDLYRALPGETWLACHRHPQEA
jgi:hypothetical protein